jgi:hypothetical protein
MGKGRCAPGIQVFRYSGVQAFRYSGVQVFGCSGIDKDGLAFDVAGPEHRNTGTPEHLNA